MTSLLGVRAGPILAALALVVAAPAAAQIIPGQNDVYGDQSDERNAGQQVAREAAAAQAAVPDSPTPRYQPDRVDLPSRRADTAERSGADEPRDTVGGSDRSVKTRAGPPSEFEAFVSETTDKPVRRFGAELLVPAARGFTTPPTTTVPPDYRLNPGDEVLIRLAGSVVADDLRPSVDADGRIFVPRVGSINVAGVRYGDLPGVIEAAVGRQYRGFRLSVTLGRLHGITIYVTGYAAVPGSYTVSSLSTLINAVLAAGGPAPGGSFRAIDVRRDDRLVSHFDLYDLLLKGDRSKDIVLQNGDVITIAGAGAQVGVIGSVNNEAIFEAAAGETLADVIRYAGGANTVADDSRVLLLDAFRSNGSGWQQLSAGDLARQPARRGEIVRVLSGLGIARPLREQGALVTISGEVAAPGRLFVPPGTTLGEIIARAGGTTPQAYPFAAVITRETVRLQQRQNFASAVHDLQFLLTARPLVSSSQSELQPARVQAVNSLIDQLEQRKPDGRLILDIAPDATMLPGGIALENNDTIYIPPRPTTVGVFGLVPSPGSFDYVPGRTIGQYIDAAGGIRKLGDRKSVFVVRANGMLIGTRNRSSRRILSAPSLPGDVVFVPIEPSRGEFWEHLQTLVGSVTASALIGASAAAIAR